MNLFLSFCPGLKPQEEQNKKIIHCFHISLNLPTRNYEPEKTSNEGVKKNTPINELIKIIPLNSTYKRAPFQTFQAPICKNVGFEFF